MPSVVHACVVELFHHAPSLATLLLEKVAGITLPPGEAVETNVALGEVIPKSYYADNVIQVQDTQGKIGAGIVVETQLNIDYEKHYSWPGYVTAIGDWCFSMKFLSWPTFAVSSAKNPAALPGYSSGFFGRSGSNSAGSRKPLKNTSHLVTVGRGCRPLRFGERDSSGI